jgi:hypothetical protein
MKKPAFELAFSLSKLSVFGGQCVVARFVYSVKLFAGVARTGRFAAFFAVARPSDGRKPCSGSQ